MTATIVSHLHLEIRNPIPTLVDSADVAVCTGDLAPVVETGAVFGLAKEWAAAERILYVPGHHEYYRAEIAAARGTLARRCRHLVIMLLDRGAVTIGGMRLLAAPLWTDFELEGVVDWTRAHEAIG